MPPKPKIRTAQALEALERLRPIVDALQETEEAVDKFGHTSFRVRDKPFVILGEGYDRNGSMAIKCHRETQTFLIEHRGFERTPYIGQHGWASVASLPPEDWAEIESLVIDAYVLVAPPKLGRQVDAGRD